MFFVYVDCKPDGTPFYIGKGTKARLSEKSRKNQQHKEICKLYPNWYRGLVFMGNEEQSLEKEKEYIAKYRPTLVNKTAGGQGITGLKHSEKAKLAVSIANKGRKWSDEAKQKMSQQRKGLPSPLIGVKLSVEHREKVRLAAQKNIGIKHSEETKLKQSLTQKGIAKPHKQYMCIECGYITSSQHLNRHLALSNHAGKDKL